jgi:peptide chain release factor 1
MYAKEHSNLEEVANAYKEYKSIEQNMEEALLLAKDEDPEIAEMAKMEIEEGSARKEELINQIKIMLLPKDPNDDKNIIMEIRGAAGGDEGNIFAGDLFRMYTRYAATKGWHIEMLDTNESEAGGFALVSFMIRGDRVYSELKYESGAHRVQRVPSTEASGRIHTSTATVIVMPEAEDVDVQIRS